jgi:hypothetical protein
MDFSKINEVIEEFIDYFFDNLTGEVENKTNEEKLREKEREKEKGKDLKEIKHGDLEECYKGESLYECKVCRKQKKSRVLVDKL